MNGVIVADKPQGWTSHDVVARVKRVLGAKKVGHLGTLDPLATGVLPLVVNAATPFARFLETGTKSYVASVKLGEETGTYDREGAVTATGGLAGITPRDIIRVLTGFTGTIEQVPPMFSSVKKSGTPLYKLARKGMVVEREPRTVEILSIAVTAVDIPFVDFTVECSRGTYIRTLCHDAGRLLGCGAHLFSLRRTGSSVFTIAEAVSPESGRAALEGALIDLPYALERATASLRTIEVDSGTSSMIVTGRWADGVRPENLFTFIKDKEMVRFMHRGELMALGEYVRAHTDSVPALSITRTMVRAPRPFAAQGRTNTQ